MKLLNVVRQIEPQEHMKTLDLVKCEVLVYSL
jgi:hypothetical protein